MSNNRKYFILVSILLVILTIYVFPEIGPVFFQSVNSRSLVSPSPSISLSIPSRDNFVITDKIAPPKTDFDYQPYLDGTRKVGFHPTPDYCRNILKNIKDKFVMEVNDYLIYKGVREEVKSLLFQAGLDYTRAEAIPLDSTIFDYIYTHFSAQVDRDILMFASINGMVDSLRDKYSSFMTPDEYKEFVSTAIDQTYVGIGIKLNKNDDDSGVRIIEVFDGPAREAGLRKNDIILSVDGKKLEKLSSEDISELIKGKENSRVEMVIIRGGKVLSKSVVRKKIIVPTVKSSLKDNIGYIKIESFKDELKDEFFNKYADLERQGIEGLVLDLRNNPGGLVSSAQFLCGFFLPRNSLVATFRHKQKKERKIRSSGRRVVYVPVVVLVNENSASSSEIVAGALKDHDAAIIVGATTRGKGSVQRCTSLRQNAGIKLTIENIFTPDNHPIQDQGITPQVMVSDYINLNKDEPLEEAIKILKKEIKKNSEMAREKTINNK